MTPNEIKKLTSQLPHNWRIRVLDNLKLKGLETNYNQIYHVLRGKIVDENLTENVLTAIAEVRQDSKKRSRRIEKLKKQLLTE